MVKPISQPFLDNESEETFEGLVPLIFSSHDSTLPPTLSPNTFGYRIEPNLSDDDNVPFEYPDILESPLRKTANTAHSNYLEPILFKFFTLSLHPYFTLDDIPLSKWYSQI